MTGKRTTTSKQPATGTLCADIRATVERLALTDDQAADYYGVPKTTIRKWLSGEREPSAAVGRLVEILGTVEALAPTLHDSFLPSRKST